MSNTKDAYQAYINQGVTAGQAGNLEQAIKIFTQAIELNPDYVSAYTNRGLAYRLMGNFEAALEDFEEAVAANPTSDNAYNNRGTAYAQSRQYFEALKDFDKAIELNPNDAEHFYCKGFTYSLMGAPQPAIENLNLYLDKASQTDTRQAVLKVIANMEALTPLQNSQDVIATLENFARSQCGPTYKPRIEVESLFTIGPNSHGSEEMVQWFMSDQPGMVLMFTPKTPLSDFLIAHGPNRPQKGAYLLGLSPGLSQNIPTTVESLTSFLSFCVEKGFLVWSDNQWRLVTRP
ncbi:tetratricopeptide repeat protein [Anaerolineales bacterium HSG6]|nr:tetratricopeptide repeat protein [Anaerolineales bacterium HSG6]MDM8531360.1 tetratricopeptide repeat protein [Anaerolineales bacterium HSG25]